jgi:MoxR-like ATPase
MGKTFAAMGSGPAERLICTEDATTADVTGMWQPAADGGWTWCDGPAIRAWRRGVRLVVDEVDRASGDVLSLLLAMTDSDGSARWVHPHTGEVVRPAAGFSVVMTSNMEHPDELPAALRDRFPIAVAIDAPAPSAVASLRADLAHVAMGAGRSPQSRRVSLRTLRAFDDLSRHCGDVDAARIIFYERSSDFLDALAIANAQVRAS